MRTMPTTLTICIILSCMACIATPGNHYITTRKWHWGRLGDQLVLYAKAKALSWQYNIPYRQYQNHKLTAPFIFNQRERWLPSRKEFTQTIHVEHPRQIEHAIKQGNKNKVLYLVSYFTRCNPFLFPEEFRDHLRTLIRPHKPITPLRVPVDTTIIAVHVRRGDSFQYKEAHGYKWHPDEEYIDAIQTLLQKLVDKKVYIHLFTDAPKPYTLVKKFTQLLVEKGINANNIAPETGKKDLAEINKPTIGCARAGKNQHLEVIVRDFFQMAACDYLIRPYGSNFSIMAQFIGRHKEVIGLGDPHPYTPKWIETCLWDGYPIPKQRHRITWRRRGEENARAAKSQSMDRCNTRIQLRKRHTTRRSRQQRRIYLCIS